MSYFPFVLILMCLMNYLSLYNFQTKILCLLKDQISDSIFSTATFLNHTDSRQTGFTQIPIRFHLH